MNPVFDKTGSLHKTLAYEILSGFYPAGSKLPSERDLSEKYRISRNTVRLTLEELEAAGAIRRRPRSGAVVTADAPAILRAAPAAQAELSAALILPPDQISNPVVQAIFTVFCKYCSEKVRISVVFIDQLASEDFRSLRADMAILFAVPEAAVRRRLAQRIGRLILLNATAGDCDYIAPDNRLAGRLIAEHLLECGHRSIGGVTFDDRDPGSDFRQRLDGCAEVFDAAGAALHLTRISALKFSDARFRRKLVEPMVKAGHSALIGGCDAIAAELRARGLSVKVDARDNVRSGFKFAEYELKGVPVRLALGPRDLENGTIELMRRDTLEKEVVPQEGLIDRVAALMDEIQQGIFDRARSFRDSMITPVDTWEEFVRTLDTKGGFVAAHWDGTVETEVAIKEATKATIRCIPLDAVDEEGVCIYSGKPSHRRVLFARSY